MSRSTLLSTLSICFISTSLVLHAADNADPAVARMREALKTATTQLASAQNDLAAAQSAAADSDSKAKSAEARVASLTKQAIADRIESDKVLAALNLKLSGQKNEIDTLNQNLKKIKDALEIKTRVAQTETNEHARLSMVVTELERRVSDLESKNVSLIQLSNEILTRYKEFSLGEALKAKEPFVGSTRVTLENLAQDYKEKIRDLRANP
jgi:chromosome segregation ATPase